MNIKLVLLTLSLSISCYGNVSALESSQKEIYKMTFLDFVENNPSAMFENCIQSYGRITEPYEIGSGEWSKHSNDFEAAKASYMAVCEQTYTFNSKDKFYFERLKTIENAVEKNLISKTLYLILTHSLYYTQLKRELINSSISKDPKLQPKEILGYFLPEENAIVKIKQYYLDARRKNIDIVLKSVGVSEKYQKILSKIYLEIKNRK